MRLSLDQESALERMRSLKCGEMLFLTGVAGSGKSTVVDHFVKDRDDVAVLASTGIAAQNIGGRTLHSFMGLMPEVWEVNPRYLEKQVRRMSVILVDEVSMIDTRLFEFAVDKLNKASENSLSYVFVGDFAQLPPVNGESCRYSRLWRDKVESIELTTVHRQSDSDFLLALNDVRSGDVRTPRVRELIASRTVEDVPDDALVLTPMRAPARTYNDERLEQLSGETGAEVLTSTAGLLLGRKWIPNKIPERLRFCEGARVLMLTNDPERRWCNGTQGVITEAWKDEVTIQPDGSPHSYRVARQEHKILDGSGKAKLIFKQFPFQLGYAVTIHKSQGMTLTKMAVDMERHFEGYAMTYVALSRCSSREGLYLLGDYYNG